MRNESSAEQFLLDLSSNPTLLSRLEQATSSAEKLEIIHKGGYTFTREEWEAALQKRKTPELSDEALDSVAGGKISRGPDWSSEQETKGFLDKLFGSLF